MYARLYMHIQHIYKMNRSREGEGWGGIVSKEKNPNVTMTFPTFWVILPLES